MGISKKTIKQKIKVAAKTKKTTKTMEMISAVKMKRLTNRMNGVRMYSRYALELLETISNKQGDDHPLIKTRNEGKILLLIIGSNKGLCGGYNSLLSKKLRLLIEEKTIYKQETDAVTIGTYAEKIAIRSGLFIKGSFHKISEVTTPHELAHILDFVIKEFSTKEYKKVLILHTSFVKPLTYEQRIRRLLPLSMKMAEEVSHKEERHISKKMNSDNYRFEPSIDRIKEKIIPQLLLAIFFETFLESLASEHGSRMLAMKNATDNAKEMERELTLWFNKIRQSSITQEIAEISSGGEALSGGIISI